VWGLGTFLLFTFRHCLAVEAPSTKSQVPNKSQVSIFSAFGGPAAGGQNPKQNGCLEFEFLNLEFIWNLDIGFWNFQCKALASIVSVALSLGLLPVGVTDFYFF